MLLRTLAAAAALVSIVPAQLVNPTIGQINGNRFLSPFNGQTVTNVSGLVTAKVHTPPTYILQHPHSTNTHTYSI